jgi:hypothetical protein
MSLAVGLLISPSASNKDIAATTILLRAHQIIAAWRERIPHTTAVQFCWDSNYKKSMLSDGEPILVGMCMCS